MERECEGVIRCSAWLGVAPRPRRVYDGALQLSAVWLMARDSNQPATKLKLRDVVMRSTLAATLGMET